MPPQVTASAGARVLRGDIHLVSLDPARPDEANKQRPAVVVSNNHANRQAEQMRRGVVTVVPITSNTSHVYPFQVYLSREDSGLRHDSKAQAEQIRSVSWSRVGPSIGRVPLTLMVELDDAIRLHLGL